jgi:hypothetical protein
MAICGQCGGGAPVLPGESYVDQDLPLFERLAGTLQDAAVAPAQAALLALELAPRNRLPPGRCLRRLTHVLPSLAVFDLLIAGDPAALHKAEGMLATLLEARARGARDSEIRTVYPPSRSKASDRS